MKNLSIDARIVPVVYRLVVTSDGVEVGRSTHQCLPAEVEAAVARVRAAMMDAGYTGVEVQA